jgi:hypothetical protein
MAGLEGDVAGESVFHVEATARFFLAVRQAIESGERVVLA